jgi:hypothetical protein
MSSNKADETPTPPTSLWTRRVLPNGDDKSVGELQVDDLETPPEEEWPMSKEPYVFISHTGRDNVKELIARPVRFFLEKVVKVKAFLDDGSIRAGTNTTEVLAAEAYRCTHALVVFSPSYRTRPFCVKELNTFMKRHSQRDGIRIIPTLWGVSNLNDYHADVSNLAWVACTSTYIVDFLVQFLWPELLNVFDRAALDKQVLEGHLCDYVETIRGGKTVVPQELESFYAQNRRQGQSLKVVFPIPAKGSSELRKLLYDAGNHYAYLEFILSASITPQPKTGALSLLTPDAMTAALPLFQEHVLQLCFALEPLHIEDSLEWLELSVDDRLLRSGTLTRLHKLRQFLELRFYGDHLFFDLAVHARHYVSSQGIFKGQGGDCWAVQRDKQLQTVLRVTAILRIRDRDQSRVVSDFVSTVDNLGMDAEYALTTLKEAIFESSEFEI